MSSKKKIEGSKDSHNAAESENKISHAANKSVCEDRVLFQNISPFLPTENNTDDDKCPVVETLAGDSDAAANSTDTDDMAIEDLSWFTSLLKYVILLLICLLAFSIRLVSVVRYESVIHEFDPYFNFRATKFLANEGFLEFLNWFDDRAWYPLGRVIGGTVYPGLMLTAAVSYWILNAMNLAVNIRNVCVFVAPVFSALASIASYLLTTEVTNRSGSGLLAAAFIAIVPSYMSRSVGGSFDNEGVAIFALIFCFYLWVKAVHTGSIMWSTFCALSYYYMVAAWGGYVFIINIIPIYVVVMVIGGRYSHRLYVSYSIFYVIGSLCAMTIPFVGFNVIDRAECAASHGVFIALQIYTFVFEFQQSFKHNRLLKQIVLGTIATVIVVVIAAFLIRLQLKGSLQWTGRSLTLLDPTYASKYIPIIASVSEHQPTKWTDFIFDLHVLVLLSPLGMFMIFSNHLKSDGALFIVLYGGIIWYFAGIMVRLMLTVAPVACILGAIGASTLLLRFCAIIKANLWWSWVGVDESVDSPTSVSVGSDISSPSPTSSVPMPAESSSTVSLKVKLPDSTVKTVELVRMSSSVSFIVILGVYFLLLMYALHCVFCANYAYSSPSIVVDAGVLNDGTRILYDDFREAYFWLRQNTPSDSKILSWWDYGYQISAMANRTVIVDNNTWNNTHIATVGRVLASSEKDAYPILESLDVNYVLVIFGGRAAYSSDDINKLMWPIKIGSGVFGTEMPNENDFLTSSGLTVGEGARDALVNSVAYKLCYYRFSETTIPHSNFPKGYDTTRQTVVNSENIILETMEEAFTSENWIVRIYKVKNRPTWNSFSPRNNSEAIAKVKVSSNNKPDKKKQNPSDTRAPVTFIGCYFSESVFKDKVYSGGISGAALNGAIEHAVKFNKRFVAIASAGGNAGHTFAFSKFSSKALEGGDRPVEECKRVTCIDETGHPCGCADTACAGNPVIKGEEHIRRWAVYELDIGDILGKKGKK